MKRIKEISLSMSEVVPMGEFRNARPHMSITWEVEGAEDMDIVFKEAQDELKKRFTDWLPTAINSAKHSQTNNTAGVMCQIHNVPLQEAISKKTGKPYKFHRVGNEMCWGK